MKKTLSIAAMLCGWRACANAAGMVTEWTGGAGPTEGNAADHQGQYYIYTEGNTVKVQYVVSGPATVTFSLLGLVAPQTRLLPRISLTFSKGLYIKHVQPFLAFFRKIPPFLQNHGTPRQIAQRALSHAHLSPLREIPLENVSAH